MNIELILWIVSYILLSEILFIFWQKHNIKNGHKDSYVRDFFTLGYKEWLYTKFMSFLFMGLVFFIQLIILGEPQNNMPTLEGLNYINLVYELIAIVIVLSIYKINKLIVNKLNEVKGEEEVE